MTNRVLILIGIFFIAFSACKKTEKDLEWEGMLIDKIWEPVGLDGTRIMFMPILEFNDDNRGKSYLHKDSEHKDNFGWEIRRKELRLYYDKAPMEYQIGQDKYNSKALFRINSVSDNEIKVTHLAQSGYETEYLFRKIVE
jgi:hypothetical protein